MAGALEVHAHVAGPKVNAGRWYRPEDKHFDSHKTPGITRIEGGKSIPTVFKTGYEYARMGFTFAMEAAMPPLYARHVHEEIHDTPIIDEAALPVFGNNWFILEYLKNHEVENTAAYIAWILRQTKGYGVKCVNPGGTEAWAWGLNCLTIHDPVPYFDITPAEIIKGLIEANEYPRPPALDAPPPERPRQPRQLQDHDRLPETRRRHQGKEQLRPRAGPALHAPPVPLLQGHELGRLRVRCKGGHGLRQQAEEPHHRYR